ncbi:hypothetical protein WN943_014477 [Citrus x changshan-huyou]
MEHLCSDSFSRNEVIRCMHMCLLRVRKDPADRPLMATIVLVLDSYSIILPVPQQPVFFIAPPERLCPFSFVGCLRVDTRDFEGVFFAIAGGGIVVASCLAVMLTMISLKLLLAFAVLVALLMTSSIAASTSSSHSKSISSLIKIFSLPLLLGVTIGGFSSFSSSSYSSSLSSSPSASLTSPCSYCCSSVDSLSLSTSSLFFAGAISSTH